LSKRQEIEYKVEWCQIKINDSEYDKHIVRLIECLLEIDEVGFEAETSSQRQAA
jgi:hypothetical protein